MSVGECECAELKVVVYGENGDVVGHRRLPPTRYHDCEWIRSRTALIPEATRRADAARARAALTTLRTKELEALWVRIFMTEMEELVDERLRGRRRSDVDGDA